MRVCDVRVCLCSVSSVFLETLISIYFEESKALKNYTPYAFNYIAYKTDHFMVFLTDVLRGNPHTCNSLI